WPAAGSSPFPGPRCRSAGPGPAAALEEMRDMIADENAEDTPVETPSSTPVAPALTVLALCQALRRRWLLATTVGALAMATAAVVAWLLTPTRYTARSLLDVAANPPKVLFATGENRGDPFHTFQKKQVALIKSRPVLTAALRLPKAADLRIVRQQIEPVEWLEQKIQADYTMAPDILKVSMTGERPEEVLALVDAVTEAYLQEIVNKEHKRRLERLDQVKELDNTHGDR